MDQNNQQPGAPIVPSPPSVPPVSSMPPAAPGQGVPPVAPKSQKKVIIIIIIVSVFVFLAIAGVAVAFSMNAQSQLQKKAKESLQAAIERESRKDNASNNSADADKAKDNNEYKVPSNCVSANDLRQGFDYLKNSKYLEDSPNTNYLVGDTIFFEAGATSLNYGDVSISRLDELANFYKNNKGKQFVYRLKSSVYEGVGAEVGSEKALAIARANKIENELISRGVPKDRIVIDESTSGTTDPDTVRNVNISIEKSGECAI